MERLQKFIASCGVASRRKAEELIIEGKVQVNGRRITELGVKIVADRNIFRGQNFLHRTLSGHKNTPLDRKSVV